MQKMKKKKFVWICTDNSVDFRNQPICGSEGLSARRAQNMKSCFFSQLYHVERKYLAFYLFPSSFTKMLKIVKGWSNLWVRGLTYRLHRPKIWIHWKEKQLEIIKNPWKLLLPVHISDTTIIMMEIEMITTWMILASPEIRDGCRKSKSKGDQTRPVNLHLSHFSFVIIIIIIIFLSKRLGPREPTYNAPLLQGWNVAHQAHGHLYLTAYSARTQRFGESLGLTKVGTKIEIATYNWIFGPWWLYQVWVTIMIMMIMTCSG